MNNYSRRKALKTIGMGAATVITMPSALFTGDGNKEKKHYITLSFDDGFKKSSIRTAEIYEKYKLSACINVIATAHLPGFVLPNEYHRWPVCEVNCQFQVMKKLCINPPVLLSDKLHIDSVPFSASPLQQCFLRYVLI